MGTRVLHDPAEGKACLYDSVTGFAFGPLVEDSGDFMSDASDLANDWLDDLDGRNLDPRNAEPGWLGTDLNEYLARRVEALT